MKTVREKLEEQINLKKTGVYDAFVNEGELRAMWGLRESIKLNRQLKVFVPVFRGEILSLSFNESTAIMTLLEEAGVETLEDLETLEKLEGDNYYDTNFDEDDEL